MPVNKASEKQLQKLKRLQQDYNEIFATPAGKRVLKDLRAVCFVDKIAFHPDPYIHAFNGGCESVFKHIMAKRRMDLLRVMEQSIVQPEEDLD